jgi:hypothetical protein
VIIYVDTSAAMKLLVEEPESKALADQLERSRSNPSDTLVASEPPLTGEPALAGRLQAARMTVRAGRSLRARGRPPGGASGVIGVLGQETGQRTARLLQVAVLTAGRRVGDRRDPVIVDKEEPGSPAGPQVLAIIICARGRPEGRTRAWRRPLADHSAAQVLGPD